MNVHELRQLGLNLIPIDFAAKRTPIVRDVKRLKWEVFQNYKPVDRCIAAWEKMFPNTAWGVVTGPISKIFVLDIDGYEGKKSIEAVCPAYGMPETWVSRTQNGGWHYYFRWDDRLSGIPTTKRGLLPNVDIRGKGGYVVSYPWVKGSAPTDVTLAAIPDWLMDLVVKPKPEPVNNPGWVASALTSLEEGQRHQLFAKLIGRLNRNGFIADDIFALLAPHAEACDFGKAELLNQVRKMTRLYADQAAKPLSTITGKQLLSTAKATIPWLVQGLMPKEGTGILAGHPKIGKSWLTLDLAITTTQGGRWLGQFNVEAGPVLYVDEESSLDLLGSRFHKLLKQKGLADANVEFLIKEGFNFSSPIKLDELRHVMDRVQPKLVVFDSLNRVHRANENSASEMGAVFREVSVLSKEYGCFILFTDHLPHGQDRFRGSTDKEAFVDTGFLTTKIGNSNLLVEHKYARITEPAKSFELAILDDGPDKSYIRWIG